LGGSHAARASEPRESDRSSAPATTGTTRVDGRIGVAGGANRLLDALSAAHAQRLRGLLRPVFLDVNTVLFDAGETIDFVDFPSTCVVSLVALFAEGITVEVATIGNEGIVGVPMVLGGSLAVRAIASVPGWVDRVDASTFVHEVKCDRHFHELVDDYVLALFGQISQAAACNRLHSNEARLSRWLLMSHDRLGTDEIAITHELLGQMLGTRRPTMTLSAERLRVAGLIRYHRGQVTIVDRAGLEGVACECYAAIRTALDGVVQRAVLRSRAADASTS
jgi:CRP-like cAMP-binding protein